MQVARLRLEPARYKAATRHTANRVGLALTNDIQAVIRTLARQAGKMAAFADFEGARESFADSDEIGALLNFAVSEGYFAIRAKLGFSIQS